MHVDTFQYHDLVHQLVHAFRPRFDRVGGHRDPAHLQCAIECPE